MKDLQEDNLFGSMRERLGRYEEAPSKELWGKIVSQKKERVWMFLIEPAGLLLVGVLLFLSHSDVTNDKKADQEKVVVSENEITRQPIAINAPSAITRKSHISNFRSDTKERTVTGTQPQIEAQPSIDALPQTANTKPQTKIDSTSSRITPSKTDSSSKKEVIPPFKKPKSKFQFYLSVTPSLSFQKMIPTGNDDVIVQGFEPRSSMSMKRFGLGIDAGFQRDINRFVGYYGGLSFYHQEQQLSYRYYEKAADVTRVGDSWVFEITRQQHTGTFNYSMTNLGARAGMLVTLKGEKLKHKFGAGLLYMHSLNTSSSYVAYQLSYRNEIRINERMSWYLEPTFIYSFISKEKLDEPFRLKPYRAGITAGFLYRF